MKIAARILSIIVLGSLALFYVSCKGDETTEKTDKDLQIEKLNGTWKVTDASLDSSDPDIDQTTISIQLSGKDGDSEMNYVVTGRTSGQPSPWPASGTVSFGTNVKTDLKRDDGIDMTYSVTDNTLTLQFVFNKTPYTGRVASVSGNWSYTLTKQ
jgi:hypothetical protein